MTSCSISRSKVRSATIFFNRLFSSSSAFSRRISSGSKPPYRVRRVNSPPDCSLILLTPVEVGRLADPRLVADLGHRRAFLALPQDKRLLRLREPRCFHRLQLLSQPRKVSRKLKFQTVQFSGGRAASMLGSSRPPVCDKTTSERSTEGGIARPNDGEGWACSLIPRLTCRSKAIALATKNRWRLPVPQS